MAFSIHAHFLLKAHYNRRMNQQVYAAAATLSDGERKKDRKAFFNSIHQTLNHIMIADITWLGRYRKHNEDYPDLIYLDKLPTPTKLDEVIFESFVNLQSAREKLDEVIINWLENDVKTQHYDEVFNFQRINGQKYRRNFAEVLFHFFNHQTHHRGQVSTLLSQCDIDIGVTDFMIDIPEEMES